MPGTKYHAEMPLRHAFVALIIPPELSSPERTISGCAELESDRNAGSVDDGDLSGVVDVAVAIPEGSAPIWNPAASHTASPCGCFLESPPRSFGGQTNGGIKWKRGRN